LGAIHQILMYSLDPCIGLPGRGRGSFIDGGLEFKDMQAGGDSADGGDGDGEAALGRGRGRGGADAAAGTCDRGCGAGAAGQATRWASRRVQPTPDGELDGADVAAADHARRAAVSNSRAERMERRANFAMEFAP